MSEPNYRVVVNAIEEVFTLGFEHQPVINVNENAQFFCLENEQHDALVLPYSQLLSIFVTNLTEED